MRLPAIRYPLFWLAGALLLLVVWRAPPWIVVLVMALGGAGIALA